MKLSFLLLIAWLWAGVAGAATVVPLYVMVRTNGVVDGPHGVISTVGTTTAGIQEAYNALKSGSDTVTPAGGKIVLVDSAPYYITSTILMSNYNCSDVEIIGPGKMAGGPVYVGIVPAPVFKITSKATAAGADPVCPMGIHIHDMFIGSLTNAATNLVEINDFARGEIDHNWIGAWEAITNNNTSGNKVGFSTCTFGNGVTNNRLVGISFRGVSDLMEVHGNSFLGCAASAYVGSDHVRIWNNFSSFVGVSNACPNTSPFSLGAVWVIQADLSHNDVYLDGNFYYNCQAAYFLFATNGNPSYNYNSVVSRNDTFEATPTNVLITANMRMRQYDPTFLRQGANRSAIVSIYPTYAVQNGRIESDRVEIISTRTNRMNTSGADILAGNGRAGMLNSAATATNSFYVYSCGITAANGWYTNPVTGPDGPGFGELVYTNGTTGYYLFYDPQQSLITGLASIAVFNSSDIQQYGWVESADDPLIWQAVPLGSSNHGTAPIGQLQPVLSGVRTIFTGDGSGLTNIPATSVAPTLIQTNFGSGFVYSNFYGVPIQVSANAVLTAAAVAGVAKLDLRISGAAGTGTTNTVAEQTGAAVITGSSTNLIMGIVPINSTYTFTNTSSGLNNSATPSGGQLIVY